MIKKNLFDRPRSPLVLNHWDRIYDDDIGRGVIMGSRALMAPKVVRNAISVSKSIEFHHEIYVTEYVKIQKLFFF